MQPNSIRVMVVNGDFTLRNGGTAEVLRRAALVSDIILGCEFKFVDAKKVLDPKVWKVIQWTDTEGKQGSLIAFRKKRVRAFRRGISLGTDNNGVRMNDRYFVWANLKIKGRRGRIRFVAGHLPPKRYHQLWPGMVRALEKLLRRPLRNARPIVVGCDWNVRKDAIAEATGLEVRSIDLLGLAYTPSLDFSVATGFDIGSDHICPRSTLSWEV